MSDTPEIPPGLPDTIGPMLFARGSDGARMRLAVVVARRAGLPAPEIAAPEGRAGPVRLLYDRLGWRVWRAGLVLPARAGAHYLCDGVAHPVVPLGAGDLRIAFVSCNGREAGDEDWDPAQRNALWARLGAEHARAPFGLLLHGGDQLYADGVLDAHPAIRDWREAGRRARRAARFTPEMEEAAERYMLGTYLRLMAEPHGARLVSEVPSMMMWDDHDIFDGWGSHDPSIQQSAVGRGIFAAARRMFLLFQLGRDPAMPTPAGGFGHAVRLPGLSVIAPDLRTTRTRDDLMSAAGWRQFERMLDATPEGHRVLLLSSVPALGPRLSLLERAMNVIPKAQEYEDDLRDQWQSRAHRAEWQRLLRALEREIEERGHPVTAVSGEIHLATRGEMRLRSGEVLHQVVASGIAHPPPPRLWARTLGLLAALGESPLDGRPIRMCPLPGRGGIYVAERNYAVFERRGGAWRVAWELEESGRTPELAI